MKEESTIIIIDLSTKQAIYGLENVTMKFSTEKVAHEIAQYLFKSTKDYTVFDLKSIK